MANRIPDEPAEHKPPDRQAIAEEELYEDSRRRQRRENVINEAIVWIIRVGTWVGILSGITIAVALVSEYATPWGFLDDSQVGKLEALFRGIGFVSVPFLLRALYSRSRID